MKGVVLGDSLLRPVKDLLHDENIKTIFRSCANLCSLTEDMFSFQNFNTKLWNNVQFLWILVGTNDIDNAIYKYGHFNVANFIAEYSHLLLTVRAHIRDIKICVCGIVPRLVDYKVSKSLVNRTNKELGKMCARFDIEFCVIDKAFCYCGIQQECYYKADRLHLSVKGAKVLVKSVQRCIAKHRAGQV